MSGFQYTCDHLNQYIQLPGPDSEEICERFRNLSRQTFVNDQYHTESLKDLPKTESLPLCIEDSRYTFSFNCSTIETIADNKSDMLNFFNTYGFVIARNVFCSEECHRTRDGMWEILEANSEGLDRNDPKTWNSLKGKGKYGLSIRGPTFHPAFIQNRQNPQLVSVLTFLTESLNTQDLIVSQDRFTVYRATQYEDPDIPGASFSTGDKNLHLDLNPWWWEENAKEISDGLDNALSYEDEQDFIKENNMVVRSLGRHVQCVLNFADNHEEDGGTVVIPYFHRYIQEWKEKHRKLRKPLPWVTLPKDIEQELLPYAHRVAMREGSVLIWDQRVIHGTAPNKSYRCRMAQYLKAYPRHRTFSVSTPLEGRDQIIRGKYSDRLYKRSLAIQKKLQESKQLETVSDIGRYVFGLDILDS